MKKFFAATVALIILTTATAFAVIRFDTPYIGNSYRKCSRQVMSVMPTAKNFTTRTAPPRRK